MSLPLERLVAESARNSTLYVGGTLRNVLLGAGLHYAVESEKYTHIPLILIFPSIYAGYHAHRNKDAVVDWIIGTKQTVKRGWGW